MNEKWEPVKVPIFDKLLFFIVKKWVAYFNACLAITVAWS